MRLLIFNLGNMGSSQYNFGAGAVDCIMKSHSDDC